MSVKCKGKQNNKHYRQKSIEHSTNGINGEICVYLIFFEVLFVFWIYSIWSFSMKF